MPALVSGRPYGASQEHQQVSQTRFDGFLDNVLDGRAVNPRQHFLGIALVAGRKRVPKPAAGMTAFVIDSP